jgi:lipopolysaccharide assembly LptE-like protein
MMKRTLSAVFFAALLLSVSGYTECYRPTGRGDGLPKHIKTLAVPPFQNPSLRYKVEQRFTSAVVDEAVHRARSLKILSNPEGADAVMIGTIKYFGFQPKLLDDFGRARLFEITITVAVIVRDQTKNKIIFENQNYVFRGEYEIPGDPKTYFNEEGPATDRLARDFAKSMISTILEGF